MPVRVLLAAVALALPTHALAAPTAVGRGAIVGGVSAAGEVAGALGGALTGGVLGGLACRDGAFECFGPLIGGGFGGGVGALVGAPLGGGLTARALGARPGRVVAFSLLGGGVGLGLAITGLATESQALGTAGVVTAAVGMPLMAGVAAGTDTKLVPPPNGPRVIVSPVVAREGAGLALTVAGF